MSSETVRVIREILPGVHERALRELRSLIAYSLAAPSPAELREQRLGLLAQMVACAPARIPLGDKYEAERDRRALDGEEWPSRSQLSRAYGSWPLAVNAAMETRPAACSYAPTELSRPPHRRPALYTPRCTARHNALSAGDRSMANPERLSAVAAHSAPHRPAAWARRTPSARRQDTPTLVWWLDAGPKCGMALEYARRQRTRWAYRLICRRRTQCD